ncbi:6231_t:CDS:1, partial [Dentiscutata erythropus]
FNSSMSLSKEITSRKSVQKRKAEVDERDTIPIKKVLNSPSKKKITSDKKLHIKPIIISSTTNKRNYSSLTINQQNV